ncbi:pathogenesis-related protein PR-1-like [Salvia splendens]|uniref:pathogenesis-related protein PR-1-like n=1 Tax=Salvia splendens TaxID=180675 RepID=UPI00110451CD|nr:pathogenesis-related protein PR-1-like [Salvia splendens]
MLRRRIPILVFLFLAVIPDNAAASSSKSQFLSVQNAARAALRLPPLAWDRRIAQFAASYARRRRADCELRHSGGPYGENIFWGSGGAWTAGQAAAEWVAERREYSYKSNSCADGRQCGHYTQIVWRETTRMGCARVVCDRGRGVFVICNYNPPGNYVGERPY